MATVNLTISVLKVIFFIFSGQKITILAQIPTATEGKYPHCPFKKLITNQKFIPAHQQPKRIITSQKFSFAVKITVKKFIFFIVNLLYLRGITTFFCDIIYRKIPTKYSKDAHFRELSPFNSKNGCCRKKWFYRS